MSLQQLIVKLFFKRGELVKFITPEFFRDGGVTVKMLAGQVECECNNRPGWYYVRECHSGAVHLIMWSDLVPADE